MVTNTTLTTELAVRAEASLVETGEKRDRLGRTIAPVARRAELVAGWRASGLTQAAFARREGVRDTTFVSWVQEEGRKPGRRTAPGRPPGRIDFAEVRWPGARAAGLEVRLPDGTVLRGGNAADLATLVRALRA